MTTRPISSSRASWHRPSTWTWSSCATSSKWTVLMWAVIEEEQQRTARDETAIMKLRHWKPTRRIRNKMHMTIAKLGVATVRLTHKAPAGLTFRRWFIDGRTSNIVTDGTITVCTGFMSSSTLDQILWGEITLHCFIVLEVNLILIFYWTVLNSLSLGPPRSIEYKHEGRKTVEELGVDFGAIIGKVLIPSFRKPHHHHAQRMKHSARKSIRRYHF